MRFFCYADIQFANEKINVRLSPEVLAALRATGRGWQTRIDACAARSRGRWQGVGENSGIHAAALSSCANRLRL